MKERVLASVAALALVGARWSLLCDPTEVWRRDTLVALNLGERTLTVPLAGELLLGTHAGPTLSERSLTLPPHAGAVVG